MNAACPVCAEPLAGRPERCFRCESPLDGWWRFEAALSGVAAGRGPTFGARRGRVTVGAMALGAFLLAVFLLTTREGRAPVERGGEEERGRPVAVTTPPAVRDPSAAPQPTPSVRYRVQRGDSPWRIAAALTGDGRRWPELFPGGAPRLVAGEWLSLAPPRPAASPEP